MVGNGNARGGGLSVIDENINPSECVNRLFNNLAYLCLVVAAGADVCLNGKNLNIIKPFKLLLRVLKLLEVAAGENKVRALFCVCRCNAVTD